MNDSGIIRHFNSIHSTSLEEVRIFEMEQIESFPNMHPHPNSDVISAEHDADV